MFSLSLHVMAFTINYRLLLSLWETAVGLLLGPGESWSLTRGHQVMQPELPIGNWVLSDPPNHKVGCAEQWSISKCERSWTDPEGTSKLHEDVVQRVIVPVLAILPSVPWHAPVASWGALYDQLTEEEKTTAWFTDSAAHYAGTTRKWTVVASDHISRPSLSDSGEGKPSYVDRTSGSTGGQIFFWEGKFCRMWDYIPIHGL